MRAAPRPAVVGRRPVAGATPPRVRIGPRTNPAQAARGSPAPSVAPRSITPQAVAAAATARGSMPALRVGQAQARETMAQAPAPGRRTRAGAVAAVLLAQARAVRASSSGPSPQEPVQ